MAQIKPEVLDALSNAVATGHCLNLVDQMDRKLYLEVNKVIEAAGGKWSRRDKAHVFDGDAGDAIENIILTGEIIKPQDFGYFPTPEAVQTALFVLAELNPGMTILEPSAGQGAIAAKLALAGHIVHCIELQEKNVAVLREMRQKDSTQPLFASVLQSDFMALTKLNAVFDRVIMNPPFAKQADIKHVLHAYQFLKPGGVLVSVMSSSVTFRSNGFTTAFREFVKQHEHSITTLPEGSFKESGTMVNTVIVKIKKPLA